MPRLAKARPIADNGGWCQQGHAAIKLVPKNYNELNTTANDRQSLAAFK
jgi:hypothetical protein